MFLRFEFESVYLNDLFVYNITILEIFSWNINKINIDFTRHMCYNLYKARCWLWKFILILTI